MRIAQSDDIDTRLPCHNSGDQKAYKTYNAVNDAPGVFG